MRPERTGNHPEEIRQRVFLFGTGWEEEQPLGPPHIPGDPTAWKNAWICTDPRGHIQATRTDDAGRTQYIYHPQWRAQQDEKKFNRVLQVAGHLQNTPTRAKNSYMDLRVFGFLTRATRSVHAPTARPSATGVSLSTPTSPIHLPCLY